MKTSFSRNNFAAVLRERLYPLSQKIGPPVKRALDVTEETLDAIEKMNLSMWYYVLNLRTLQVIRAWGTDRYFSRNEEGFDWYRSYSTIHDSYRELILEYDMTIISQLMHGNTQLIRKMNQGIYQINFVVQQAAGKLISVKRSAQVMYYDEAGKVVKILITCSVMDNPYKERKVLARPRLIHKKEEVFGNVFYKEEQEFVRLVCQKLAERYSFTLLQSKIMKRYVQGYSMKEVAKEWDPWDYRKGYENVKAHNGRILERGRSLFPLIRFKNAKEVAFFFHRLGFLES